MPELKNEIPTDQELYDYFIEHIRNSCFSSAYSADAAPEATDELSKSVEALYRTGFGPVVRQMADSILDGLLRLNRLQRNDPFWDNTNRRPTIYKLNEFCKRTLRETPDDNRCLRSLGALAVWFGSDSFGQEYWIRLHELGDLDVAWPIVAALISEICVGNAASETAKLLLTMRAANEARSLIEKLKTSEDEILVSWSNRVLKDL